MMMKKTKGPFVNDDVKVIICIDMDAYYAQAEARRLNIDNNCPLAVQQWHSLIAVNYAARARGVLKSFTLAKDAKVICPEIILPHVDTIRIGKNGEVIESTMEEKFKPHDRFKEKVSLKWYRSESYRILEVIKRQADFIERASIDEVFIDITDKVLAIMNKGEYERKWKGKILGVSLEEEDAYELPTTAQEIGLMIGSQFAENLRIDVYNSTGYTSSAGVSFNKMLAKLGSGLNKPYNQTVIIPSQLPGCLSEVKIKKIRGFGGKIGGAFENEKQITTLGEVLKLSMKELEGLLGSKEEAEYVYKRARGFDTEEIRDSRKEDYRTKSIMSAKLFQNNQIIANNQSQIEVHINLIITDLFERFMSFYEDTKSVPKTIAVGFWNNATKSFKTKQTDINLNINENEFREMIEKKTWEILKTVEDIVYPCGSLAITLRNFSKSEYKTYAFDLKSYSRLREGKNKEEAEGTLDEVPRKMCELCKSEIPVEGFDSHLDYHLACDLDREINPRKRKYQKDKNEEAAPAERENSKEKPLKGGNSEPLLPKKLGLNKQGKQTPLQPKGKESAESARKPQEKQKENVNTTTILSYFKKKTI